MKKIIYLLVLAIVMSGCTNFHTLQYVVVVLGLVYFILVFLIAKMKRQPFRKIEDRLLKLIPNSIGYLIAKCIQGIILLIILLAGLFILFLLIKFIKWAWYA